MNNKGNKDKLCPSPMTMLYKIWFFELVSQDVVLVQLLVWEEFSASVWKIDANTTS